VTWRNHPGPPDQFRQGDLDEAFPQPGSRSAAPLFEPLDADRVRQRTLVGSEDGDVRVDYEHSPGSEPVQDAAEGFSIGHVDVEPGAVEGRKRGSLLRGPGSRLRSRDLCQDLLIDRLIETQNTALTPSCRVVAVRFGNVLGSTG